MALTTGCSDLLNSGQGWECGWSWVPDSRATLTQDSHVPRAFSIVLHLFVGRERVFEVGGGIEPTSLSPRLAS